MKVPAQSRGVSKGARYLPQGDRPVAGRPSVACRAAASEEVVRPSAMGPCHSMGPCHPIISEHWIVMHILVRAVLRARRNALASRHCNRSHPASMLASGREFWGWALSLHAIIAPIRIHNLQCSVKRGAPMPIVNL
jgi:hypothetical protein